MGVRAHLCVLRNIERFPTWHYVDIHDQLISLTSSLCSQMDALLEPFSNQPPAPAKLSVFYNFKCFIFGKQIAELDWNQSTFWKFACSQNLGLYGVLIELHATIYAGITSHMASVSH